MATVSIVVPSYNHARYLRQRVASILAQTYQDFELILLDDCSADESREILTSYAGDPRVRIEFNEKNSGGTFSQWNKGARLARGKYIWFAESDDYADERLLETLVRRLDVEPDNVLCYCRSWQVSSEGHLNGYQDSYLPDFLLERCPGRWGRDFRADGVEECRGFLVRCNTVLSASSVVFRKDVYWQAGGADEALVLCGDWKMWAAMALCGGSISYVGEPLNYYRYHGASVSEKSKASGIWALEALEVARFIAERTGHSRVERAKLCEELSPTWTQAVLNKKVPLERRRAIFRNAMTLNRGAILQLVRAGLKVLGMGLRRRMRDVRVLLTSRARRSEKPPRGATS